MLKFLLIVVLGKECITKSDDFAKLCFEQVILKTTLAAIHHLRGDKHKLCNRAYRFAAYKLYVWWVYGYLGKGQRKVIPSCVIWAIRDRFPEPDGLYVSFSEGNIEMD